MGKNIVLIYNFSYLILLIGIAVFLFGIINFFHSKSVKQDIVIKTSLTERDIAIADAIKNGKKEYSYETSFTPGVGRIINPDAYKDQWQKNAEQSINEQNIQTQGSQNPLSWQEKLQQGLNKYIQ